MLFLFDDDCLPISSFPAYSNTPISTFAVLRVLRLDSITILLSWF